MTDDEAFRNVAADEMAVAFVVDFLLGQYFMMMPPHTRKDIAQTLLTRYSRLDHFAGFNLDDETSELLADVTVRSHGALERLLNRVLTTAG